MNTLDTLLIQNDKFCGKFGGTSSSSASSFYTLSIHSDKSLSVVEFVPFIPLCHYTKAAAPKPPFHRYKATTEQPNHSSWTRSFIDRQTRGQQQFLWPPPSSTPESTVRAIDTGALVVEECRPRIDQGGISYG